MKKTYISIAIIIILVGAIIYSANNDLDVTSAKVGVIAPLSGIVASYGEELKKGIDSASSPLTLIYEDDGCEPHKAVSAMNKLLEIDKVSLIIGPACGSPQEAIVPLVKNKNVIVILPSAASDELYSQSNGKIYNLHYSLQEEARFLAEQIYLAGYQNVAVIGYNNAFSKVHMDTFKGSFKGILTHETLLNETSSGIKTELLKIKLSNPEAIFIADVSFFFAQGPRYMKEIGLDVPVYSQYAVEIDSVKPLAEGVIYSFPEKISLGESAIRSIGKEAVQLTTQLLIACGDSYTCMKEKLETSGLFDENGIAKRGLVLKQIKDGKPLLIP